MSPTLGDRYYVRRRDHRDVPGEKHHGCEYFVIDLTHDEKGRALKDAYFAPPSASTCESGRTDCGEVVWMDADGAGMCARCIIESLATARPEPQPVTVETVEELEALDPNTPILTAVNTCSMAGTLLAKFRGSGHVTSAMFPATVLTPATARPEHVMVNPSLTDLRYTCTGCRWTASEAFSDPHAKFQKDHATARPERVVKAEVLRDFGRAVYSLRTSDPDLSKDEVWALAVDCADAIEAGGE
ncbi:hypothetical protein RN607_00605 [Demequina capsici]|uniref:Uncharacterized protein n=1 Tax=Demequina capsici TaxID=3075620 RepID=A0AA96FCW5_9MICO|nr:hypothetical protein [Demequina sp. PMTSA13]WNM27533.1 hypothetical protein RN607_00605 [Demequina sp. PMTSA13]